MKRNEDTKYIRILKLIGLKFIRLSVFLAFNTANYKNLIKTDYFITGSNRKT